MNYLIAFGAILLFLAIFLIVAIIFFSVVKYIQRRYYPKWKFPDYISVGYAEYLYKKYIKRSIP
ncbi:hypothetical protein [Mucilaginibacter sp. FT3.2]|uniref:hypothetical protein n=1 Tax=Mucilaginibacter sp. FT3.2 TaxID=2723090 RepID=UPI001614E9B5|nr:hypothetical protein [Mucilaginibacter sp. FT3.2]MBB6231719.1 hypothetical protein [Mucilaginibacter sp. FT3.2]